MMKYIFRLSDMGCLENVLPIAEFLQKSKVEGVAVYLDPGSMAEDKYSSDVMVIESIPEDCRILTCLPLGAGFEKIQQLNSIDCLVLIHENSSEPNDVRLAQWINEGNKFVPDVVCTLSDAVSQLVALNTSSKIKVLITGLPAIDAAIKPFTNGDKDELKKELFSEHNKIALIALPGDYSSCLRVCQIVKMSFAGTDYNLIFSSHPKFKRNDPEGYEKICQFVDDCDQGSDLYTLGEADSIGSNKFMTALGIDDYFIGTHDTTMLWQAAVNGINCLVIPPPDDSVQWAMRTPVVLGKHAFPLLGILPNFTSCPIAVDSKAVKNLARVLVKN